MFHKRNLQRFTVLELKCMWIILCKNIHLLTLTRQQLDENAIGTLESLVLSQLSYCVIVWGSSIGCNLLQRLQRIQNHAVRSKFCRNMIILSPFYQKL